MSTFVLVHGAWHGAWCWYKTTPLLEQAGHRVVVNDLPAHGIDRTPIEEVTFHDQAESVGQVLDRQDGPVKLVGHSSGGAVITQAAEQRPDAVDTLIYLSAFLPPDGTSVMDLAQRDEDSAALRSLLVDEQAGHATVQDDAVREAFYHDCPESDVHLARTLLRPEPLTTIGTPVSTTSDRFGSIRRVYIGCSDDRAVTPDAQADMWRETPCDEVLTLDTGHSPFLADPRALADLLLTT